MDKLVSDDRSTTSSAVQAFKNCIQEFHDLNAPLANEIRYGNVIVDDPESDNLMSYYDEDDFQVAHETEDGFQAVDTYTLGRLAVRLQLFT